MSNRKIQEIFDLHYKERASEKANNVRNYFTDYYKGFKWSTKEVNLLISYQLLEEVILGYFIDVIKYKESHFSCDNVSCNGKHTSKCIHVDKRINYSKSASFSLYWLLKHPIAFIDTGQDIFLSSKDKKQILAANAMCSLSYSLSLIGIDDIDDNEKIYDDIIYHLLFRPYDVRHFIIMFEMLEKKYK